MALGPTQDTRNVCSNQAMVQSGNRASQSLLAEGSTPAKPDRTIRRRLRPAAPAPADTASEASATPGLPGYAFDGTTTTLRTVLSQLTPSAAPK